MNKKEFKKILNDLNVTTLITLTYPMSFVVKPVSEICATSSEFIPVIRNRVRSNPGYWLEIHLRKFIIELRKSFYYRKWKKKIGNEFLYISRKEFKPIKHPSILILSNLSLEKAKIFKNITEIWSNIVYENSFFPGTVKVNSYLAGDLDYSNKLNFILREPLKAEEMNMGIGLKRAIDCYLLEKKERENARNLDSKT